MLTRQGRRHGEIIWTLLTCRRRRTRQSGPLGELFDHGVDALNTGLGVLIFAGSQNMGQTWYTVATLFACMFLVAPPAPAPSSLPPPLPLPILALANPCSPALLTFYVQTWDEYHTKTLTLGIVNGPVEGVLILVLVYGLTGYMGGASFWHQPMLPTLGVSANSPIPSRLYALSFTEWYMVQGGVVLVFNTVESIRNVLRARRARGERSRHALLGLLPFFGIWGLVVSYLYLQPTILSSYMVPFALFAGIVNAYSVGQMITAHLTHLPFPYFNALGLPLLLAVLDSAGPHLRTYAGFGWPSLMGDDGAQVAYLFLMLGVAAGVYGSFVVDVIVSICDYLDIWCLTIKHPFVAPLESANGKKAA